MYNIIINRNINKSKHLFSFISDPLAISAVRKVASLLIKHGIEMRMVGRHPDRNSLADKYGLNYSRAGIPLRYAERINVYVYTRKKKGQYPPLYITIENPVAKKIMKLVEKELA